MLFGFNAEEIFDMAVTIEENGHKFYEKAKACVGDENVKRLFQELAEEELKHRKRFQELKSQIPQDVKGGGVYDPDNEVTMYLKMMANEHVFRESEGVSDKVCSIKSTEEALKLAIQFEKDSIIFFLTMKDHTESPKGKELVDLLIKEEQEHLRQLMVTLGNLKKQ